MNLLYKKAFYTEAVVLFDNITVGYDSIEFNFAWYENFASKTLSTLTLYQGETVAQTLAVDKTSVNGLLSGKEYKLIAEYKNGEATESIYLEFTTHAKARPTIAIQSVTRTQTSIAFEINETDEDNAGEITKIELLHGEDEPIVAESLDVREFTGLLSNNEYTVKVTYVYNLNDGAGDKELILTDSGYTLYSDTLLTYELYTIKGNTYYSVTYCDRSATSAIIEDHIAGIPVTSIGDFAFDGCTNLTSVTIGDSVTLIGYDAFASCFSLTSVEIPDSVTSIGEGAFSVCANLTSVTIGDSVTTIGEHAFSCCYRLMSVEIPDSVTTIGNSAFVGCESLTNIVIPNSITSIGNNVFSSCFSLTSVKIPDSVTSIGIQAFCDCIGLMSIEIPDSVTSIGAQAFRGCRSITNIEIPNGVTSIGEGAFCNATSLLEVYCHAIYPPFIKTDNDDGSYVFDATSDDICIYIPIGSEDHYLNDEYFLDHTYDDPDVKAQINWWYDEYSDFLLEAEF